jgi:hypothetical protein
MTIHGKISKQWARAFARNALQCAGCRHLFGRFDKHYRKHQQCPVCRGVHVVPAGSAGRKPRVQTYEHLGFELEWERAGEWLPECTLAARRLPLAISEAEQRVAQFGWSFVAWRLVRRGKVVHRGHWPPPVKPLKPLQPIRSQGLWHNL